MKSIFAFITLFASALWAQTTTTIMTTTTLPQILSTMQSINDKIPIAAPAGIGLIAVFIVDMIARFYPTANAQSVPKWVALFFMLLGQGFMKLSTLLDSVFQNVKDPSTK